MPQYLRNNVLLKQTNLITIEQTIKPSNNNQEQIFIPINNPYSNIFKQQSKAKQSKQV